LVVGYGNEHYATNRVTLWAAKVCRELNRLFEDVAPMTFEETKAGIESELGGPLEGFFPIFNQEPVAAASMAQVYEARTHGNE
jgi:ubiquinone biosynthesis protein